MALAPETGRMSHPSSTHPVVKLEELVREFGRGEGVFRALDGVSLEVTSGSFLAVMGPSGSGKSTMLQIAAGLDSPTSGRVELGSTDLSELNEKHLARLRREQLGYVFQSFNLLGALTAEQNVALPSRLAGRRLGRQKVRVALEQVGLGDRTRHRPGQLSGGQQQRVAIARALVSNPEVIFADEPTGALDSRSGREVLEILRRSVDESGRTIVMVTHDPGAAAWADRVVFLADGQVAGTMQSPTSDAVAERLANLGD